MEAYTITRLDNMRSPREKVKGGKRNALGQAEKEITIKESWKRKERVRINPIHIFIRDKNHLFVNRVKTLWPIRERKSDLEYNMLSTG